MDRDERKLDIFLTFHRSSLLVSDMKIFLPFTINLDPYIKKKIKEEQQSIEEEAGLGPYKQYSPWTMPSNPHEQWNGNKSSLTNRPMKFARVPSLQMQAPVPSVPQSWCMQPSYDWQCAPWAQMPPMGPPAKPLSATTTLPVNTPRGIAHKTLNRDCTLVPFLSALFSVRDPGDEALVSNSERRLRSCR